MYSIVWIEATIHGKTFGGTPHRWTRRAGNWSAERAVPESRGQATRDDDSVIHRLRQAARPKCAKQERPESSLHAKQAAQLVLRSHQDAFLLRGQTSARPVDIEIQHRHRRLKGRCFAPAAPSAERFSDRATPFGSDQVKTSFSRSSALLV
jgi:hypothetical protein